MLFETVPVNSALGAILAHGVRADGKLLRKGRILSREDLSAIAKAGLAAVTVARPGPDDIAEDEAATRIAARLDGANVRIGAAFTGRANLYAAADGVFVVDAVKIDALNSVDEAITLATLAAFTPVRTGQMLATVKIIPFAAPAAAVARAETILDRETLRVAAFAPRKAALISTALPGMKESLLDKNRTAIEARLRTVGSALIFERRVAHETAAVADAIADAKRAGCDPILVFGASAITDRRDVIPAAVERAGGAVAHFGMPVDPGNLLMMGRLGDATVVGLPGCARSPKRNGFDFVLWRLAAGLPVGRSDIAAMGVGGLLMEIPTRPQPRDEPAASIPHAPKIAAVVLAAGLSSRMGSNKLLAQINGAPLVRHAVAAAAASAAKPVIIVTGNDAENVRAILSDLDVAFVHNADFANGLSTSLKAGIAAVPAGCDGAIVVLGDMPGISAALIDKMIAAFDPTEDRVICVATRGGKHGNPVLWARRFFPEIAQIEGDVGAKSLIGAYGELVCEVEAADDAPLVDIDTPQALEAYRAR
ncbi:MAG: molybdopterin-binding/glycosyltransferase family 2 protein [Proteobacteria bacterium]|nr:molybdopterin-binding/glycosyltransferase family 2 protein [Pseudomonadota bacterium]